MNNDLGSTTEPVLPLSEPPDQDSPSLAAIADAARFFTRAERKHDTSLPRWSVFPDGKPAAIEGRRRCALDAKKRWKKIRAALAHAVTATQLRDAFNRGALDGRVSVEQLAPAIPLEAALVLRSKHWRVLSCILAALVEFPGAPAVIASHEELGAVCGLSGRTTRRKLADLVELELVRMEPTFARKQQVHEQRPNAIVPSVELALAALGPHVRAAAAPLPPDRARIPGQKMAKRPVRDSGSRQPRAADEGQPLGARTSTDQPGQIPEGRGAFLAAPAVVSPATRDKTRGVTGGAREGMGASALELVQASADVDPRLAEDPDVLELMADLRRVQSLRGGDS